MTTPVIWMNGRMTPAADARVSIFDHGLLYGDGVFEGIRFYGRRPFRLDPHLERLERSAAVIDLTLPYTRTELAEAMRAVITAFADDDGYLRLVVTRGEGDLGLDPRSCRRATVFVAAAHVRVFADAAQGVPVVVARTRQAPLDALDPRIKSLNYLNRIMAKLEASRAGAAEAIMLNHAGRIAEGTADNLFVVRAGALLTPPATDGALEGITREVILEVAASLGIAAREQSLGAYDLVTADEAFLSGTGAGIVAIRSVDGRHLAACPGPVFRRIDEEFARLVRG
ncbi:MAG TPA: branched-chain-amino-acid transaminase [Polyangiaceae bacterium]|nr:branched-chain-amino-acid transaminase [Polyangiaceae bacterium]